MLCDELGALCCEPVGEVEGCERGKERRGRKRAQCLSEHFDRGPETLDVGSAQQIFEHLDIQEAIIGQPEGTIFDECTDAREGRSSRQVQFTEMMMRIEFMLFLFFGIDSKRPTHLPGQLIVQVDAMNTFNPW
jgi:hypothetical protein